jgi:hypothetical protein
VVPSCQSRLFAGLQALPALAADRKSAARKTTTFVLLLYHRQHPTFAPLLPNRQKSRVRGFSGCPSGRLSRRERQSPINTPGSRGCGYKTASGRRQWPNRDPLGEPGFETMRNQSADPLGDGLNLYAFVHNRPTDKFDPLGLVICDDSCRAILELLKAMKRALDNLPDNPRGCLESPCASVTSFRAICDCMWDAAQKANGSPAQLDKASADAAGCICLISAQDNCQQTWQRRVKVIFGLPKGYLP